MNSPALSAPAKTTRILLRFTHGGLPPVLYTTWTDPVVWIGERYEPTPSIEVEIPANTIAIKEEPLVLTMPIDAWTDRLSSGYPHALVSVDLIELVETDQHKSHRVLFRGQVNSVVRNPKGNPGAVKIEAQNLKARLDVSLGMQTLNECGNIFGDAGCGISLEPLAEDRLVLNVSGVVLLVTGLTAKPWDRGFVRRQGLTIPILYVSGQQIVLRQYAPIEWANQTVRVYPGCKLTIAACRDDWANEPQFVGIGFATPDYNPILEVPG